MNGQLEKNTGLDRGGSSTQEHPSPWNGDAALPGMRMSSLTRKLCEPYFGGFAVSFITQARSIRSLAIVNQSDPQPLSPLRRSRPRTESSNFLLRAGFHGNQPPSSLGDLGLSKNYLINITKGSYCFHRLRNS